MMPMNRVFSVVPSTRDLILVMAVAFALPGLTACARLTEIVLVIDTDMIVPVELDLVDISVIGPSGPAGAPPPVDLKQPGAPAFPMTLGLIDAGSSSMVSITVTGRHRDANQVPTDVATVRAQTHFVEGQKLMLPILLTASCQGVTCSNQGDICKLGSCIPLVLTPWTGKPTPSDVMSPTVVDGRTLWANGWRSCATKGQSLYCWGENDNGQTGDGVAGLPEKMRVLVKGLPDGGTLKSIGLGYKHSCVCDGAGQAWCWGANESGEVTGTPTAMPQLTPVKVPGVSGCVQIAGGNSHTCAIVTGNRVSCWGLNDLGQAGQPLTMAMTAPQTVAGAAAIFQVQAGDHFTCAISTTNSVFCWGDNRLGQLGDGSTTARSFTPKKVVGLPDRPQSLSLGRNFACLLLASGQVSCWGENSDMMIAPGAAMGNMAALISGVENDAVQIAAGHQHACVLRKTGIVSCWGSNQFGQLGSTSMTTAVPVDVVGIGAMTAVAVGDQHGCARDAKGAVYCWGQDINGQLGDGGSSISTTPVQTVGF